MTSKIPEHVETLLSSASLEDLERLIRGIDHKFIIEMVKHTKHLQQHVFPGFRATNLPWQRVPTKLARDAQGKLENLVLLLDLWHKTNGALCESVSKEVSVESIEDDVAQLLTSMDHDGKDRLLWALLLDERGEIQLALINGLRDALTNESSTLMSRVEQHRLAKELEETRQELSNLRSQIGKLEKQNHLLNHKAEQSDELRAKLKAETEEAAQIKMQYQDAIRRHDTALQAVRGERDNALREMQRLQYELEQERSHSKELQQSVEDLRNTLESSIASQRENTSEIKQRLNNSLGALEEERKENAKLRLHIGKLEREKGIAYDKRDELLEQVKDLTTRIENLEHDKKVLIQQKRDLHAKLKLVETDLHQKYQLLAAGEKEQNAVLSLSQIDEAWDKAIDGISKHFSSVLSEPLSDNQEAVGINERWADWQHWQYLEEKLVHPLLSSLQIVSGVGESQDLNRAESAQKLLMLRWYLLEWFRLTILEMLHADNRARVEYKESAR